MLQRDVQMEGSGTGRCLEPARGVKGRQHATAQQAYHRKATRAGVLRCNAMCHKSLLYHSSDSLAAGLDGNVIAVGLLR